MKHKPAHHRLVSTKFNDLQAFERNSCRGKSVGEVGDLAGLNVAVAQAEGVQFLKAGIDLLVHRGILGGDVLQLSEETSTALVVVVLGSAQTLSMLGGVVGGLGGTVLGVDGAGALHSRSRSGTSDSSLADGRGVLLLGGGNTDGRGLG